MPFFQVKNFFLKSIWWIKSLKLLDAVSRLESNLDTFKDIGRLCSKVVLFFIIGKSRDPVRLGKCSK